MDQVEYIKSNKGGIKIIYKGYMYTIHKNKKCGGIRWRCAQRSFNCKGSISTNLSGLPNINMPHNHLPDYKSIAIAKNKFENILGGLSNFAESGKLLKNPATVLVLNNMADHNSKYDLLGVKKLRKSNFSPEEVEALVATVGKNYHILYGEFAKRAVNKQARHKVWVDVTKQVNRVSLEKRTLQEVKNKWKKCQHLYKEQESVDDIVLPNVWEPLTTLKDSMPLEQRLKSPPEQEPVLQSQPLSPTKLKVTRQSTKPPHPSPKPPTPEPPNEEVCLRWNSHHSNMQTSFPNLLLKEQYVDATLVAEGQSLKCHRLILSSCSPYFEEVLSGISPFQHPVLFMKDIPFWVLKSLCDFMYAGEVHIFQNKLEELLAVAESLKIKGLAGKMDSANEEAKPAEPSKPIKEEKKDEKEVKEKKRNFQFFESAPRTSSRTVRSVQPPKKPEKPNKEPFNKEGILDPLDLLEPVYEEVTKETAPVKAREVKTVPLKRGKFKKRKFSEEREESPPPLFLSRKGTRSRPNVKIPKYYHTHYERMSESTIVREPHTTQPDPLLPLEDIKSEPLDLENDVIEIEDNVIGFTDVPEIPPHEEEIIGNYDSPLVNLDNTDKTLKDSIAPFKKINLIAQPIIMNVHSVSEKSPSAVQIIDITELTGIGAKSSDPLATVPETDKPMEDPLNFIHEPMGKGTSGITITNVHSVVEMDVEERASDNATQEQQITETGEGETAVNEFQTEKVESEKEDNGMEISCPADDVFVENYPVNGKEPQDKTDAVDSPKISTDDQNNVTEKIHGDAIEMERDEPPEVEEQNTVVKDKEPACEDEMEEPARDDEKEELARDDEKEEPARDDEKEEPARDDEKEEPARDDEKEPARDDEKEKPARDDEKEPVCDDEKEEPARDDETEEPARDEREEPARADETQEPVPDDETEEPAVELGFHIAKVASEQFASIGEPYNSVKDVISEDCAGELGFQITNVVSGIDSVPVEESHNCASGSDLGTFPNHLEENKDRADEMEKDVIEFNSVVPGTGDSSSEDTQFLAESLEKLLDK